MPTLNKNDIVELEITDITFDGDGIAKFNGYTIFVKNSIIGDIVKAKILKAKSTYSYAKVEEVIKASPYRVEPVCNISRQCGGCQLQHLKYEKQLEYKQNKIKNCLERIGGFKNIIEIKETNTNLQENSIIMQPIIGMDNPYFYRNKAQFPVGRNKEGNVVAGFYANRTHSIIDTQKCFIQAKVNEKILKLVKEFITENNISTYDEKKQKGLIRHILTRIGFVTNEIMVCIIINGDKLPKSDKLIEKLKHIEGMTSISININKENTNVILGKKIKILFGKAYITDYIGDIKYQISPLSFYQVNPIQTKKLYDKVVEFANIQGNEIIWDLYCGIGTISLFLSKYAKEVYGVEIVEEAIEDAKQNAKINNIQNVSFFVGAAEEVLPNMYMKGKVKYADIIVVDPPRKGCEQKLLDTIIKMKPKKFIYVSCDPATMARDLKYMCQNEYKLEKICGVDQFAMSTHVETVVLLSQRKADDYVKVDL